MKYNNKDLTLMVWDDKTGKYEFFVLNPALSQTSNTKFFCVIGDKVGEVQ